MRGSRRRGQPIPAAKRATLHWRRVSHRGQPKARPHTQTELSQPTQRQLRRGHRGRLRRRAQHAPQGRSRPAAETTPSRGTGCTQWGWHGRQTGRGGPARRRRRAGEPTSAAVGVVRIASGCLFSGCPPAPPLHLPTPPAPPPRAQHWQARQRALTAWVTAAHATTRGGRKATGRCLRRLVFGGQAEARGLARPPRLRARPSPMSLPKTRVWCTPEGSQTCKGPSPCT